MATVPENTENSLPNQSTQSENPSVNNSQEEALDSLGIVVGEIAHDFNNILSLIFGYVEMALSEIPEGERARSDLEHVLAAGDRAKELVARILTYSNRAKVKKEPIAILQPVQRVLNSFKDKLPHTIALNFEVDEREAYLLSNETEITQLITNLLNNSLQAMQKEGGEIKLDLEYIDQDSEFTKKHPTLTENEYVHITIKDTGCGMDMSTLEKIYTPFFTTSRGGGRSESRAGLGLTTVYNIVTSQNGFIFANSILNEGSSFEICLPLASKYITAEKKPVHTAIDHQKHVLFIDDEPAITEMASHILEQSGYKVMLFNDGNDALNYFAEHPYDFDIIITDLIMPVISGSELASKCADINPAIPIMLTTGFSEKITPASCRQWGVTTVITKPFSIQQLLTTVDELTKTPPT